MTAHPSVEDPAAAIVGLAFGCPQPDASAPNDGGLSSAPCASVAMASVVPGSVAAHIGLAQAHW